MATEPRIDQAQVAAEPQLAADYLRAFLLDKGIPKSVVDEALAELGSLLVDVITEAQLKVRAPLAGVPAGSTEELVYLLLAKVERLNNRVMNLEDALQSGRFAKPFTLA